MVETNGPSHSINSPEGKPAEVEITTRNSLRCKLAFAAVLIGLRLTLRAAILLGERPESAEPAIDKVSTISDVNASTDESTSQSPSLWRRLKVITLLIAALPFQGLGSLLIPRGHQVTAQDQLGGPQEPPTKESH